MPCETHDAIPCDLPFVGPSQSQSHVDVSELKVPQLFSHQLSCATLIDVLSHAAGQYPSQELSFIGSSACDSSIRRKTFSEFNQSVRNLARALFALDKPPGSIILVYLTEHEDNMAAVWACLLAGYIPCLQPPLTIHQTRREAHLAHITSVTCSATWLTNEAGANKLRSVPGLKIHLFSELRIAAKDYCVPADWVARCVQPDNEAIFFLTSGSSGFSKVVVHTHRTILAACFSKGVAYGMTSESKVLNWVGFDHAAGSIEMHITPLMYGASQLHVHASVVLSDSLRFLRLIDAESISLTFAPNFLLSKLVRDLEKRRDLFGRFDLSSIVRINSGGEAVVSKNARAFITLMKNLARDGSKLPLIISAGFGMTETCAGCIYNCTDVSVSEPKFKFLENGTPIPRCEMRIVRPEDGMTVRPDGESGELQLRGPMLFVRYYNNIQATELSFVKDGWYRTGDVGIIDDGALRLSGRMQETVVVRGVSCSIPEVEIYLQTVEGVMHSFLAAAPYRTSGEHTQGFIIFYSPTFDLYGEGASVKLVTTNHTLRSLLVKMTSVYPYHIVPIPPDQMEKTTLGKLSHALLITRFKQGELATHIARAEELLEEARRASFVSPSSETEKIVARIYADILNLNVADISAADNFFELGGTSVGIIRLKKEGESIFDILDIPIIHILKHPVVSSLANYIDALKSKSIGEEEYDPIVPLNLTGNETPVFMVHSGFGEVLSFVNLARYFHDDRPFYAVRARGFEPGHPFFTSMDEIVTSYTDAIKRTQRHGPYAIAGYSYGGPVAFEVAKRLEAMGDEVRFTGIIDVLTRIVDYLQNIDWTGSLLHLSRLLGLVSMQDVHGRAQSLRALSRQEQLDAVLASSSRECRSGPELAPEELGRCVDMVESLMKCRIEYNLSGSVSGVDVFYATTPGRGSKEVWLNALSSWGGFSREEPVYTHVPGQHYTLMDSEHVADFQRIFRNRLEARGL